MRRDVEDGLRNTKFREWWYGMPTRERIKVSDGLPIKYSYIKLHLVPYPPHKRPTLDTLHSLVEASGGYLTMNDMVEHFHMGQKGSNDG